MDSILPVLLNRGIDTVTPAPLTEPGTLLNCLNYEMTADIGYRRIDGYETYDGWISGDIIDYYLTTVAITDGSVVLSLVPGTLLVDFVTKLVVGVLLNYNSSTNELTYSPVNNEAPIITSGTHLSISTTDTDKMNTTVNATKGSVVHNAATFTANVRAYATALRNLIVPFSSAVAGLQWHRNNLVVALDAPRLAYVDVNSGSRASVQEGSTIGYGTGIYRVIHRVEDANNMTLHLEPIGTQATNSSLRVYFSDLVTISSTSATATSFVLTTNHTDWAYLVALNNPETSQSRGYRRLKRSVTLRYNTGSSGMLNMIWSSKIRLVNGVNVLLGTVVNHIITGGDYGANTGTGFLEVVLDDTGGSGYLYPQFADVIEAGLGGSLGVINLNPTWSKTAGTNRLRKNQSHYVGMIKNFYGDELRTESYVATGASRSLWVRAYDDPLTKLLPTVADAGGATSIADSNKLDWCWGNNIAIQDNEALDIPKYVSYHAGALALGFERGSVMISAPGEPRNFSGLDGAMEIATGDAITGMLESVEDTTIVFGRRSIRRITGRSSATAQLRTIVPNAGCFDYTAVNVAGQPVFTGPNGIGTLQQAQEYGDFIGTRATERVANTLIPKLVTDWSDSAPGGTAMAMAVRSKNQYRLWLTTGEVYVVTFTADGPKVTRLNYATYAGPGVSSTLNVPLAWCSEVADTLKEHIHVVWDAVLASKNVNVNGNLASIPSEVNVYELERGWGFTGMAFSAWFDLAHIFPTKGVMTTGVEKVRLYGMGHGLATLDVKTSGVEYDFEQTFNTTVQDISMPSTTGAYFSVMQPVTSIIDQANWGLGIKIRINNTVAAGSTDTEPPHICQVMDLSVRTEGALDG